MLPPPIIKRHGDFWVVRDDLLEGGTKRRVIQPLVERMDAQEFVYASPAYGYAQYALAVAAREAGKRATIFTAKRKQPHRLTLAAHRAGAKVVMVPYGYLSNVQAKTYRTPEKFEADAKRSPPWPASPNYDAKAWAFMQRHGAPGALFWNVGA